MCKGGYNYIEAGTTSAIGTVDSSRIYAEIERDMTDEMELREAWSNAVNSVWVSGSEEETSEEQNTDSQAEEEIQ